MHLKFCLVISNWCNNVKYNNIYLKIIPLWLHNIYKYRKLFGAKNMVEQ